jgi:hypothetical protein
MLHLATLLASAMLMATPASANPLAESWRTHLSASPVASLPPSPLTCAGGGTADCNFDDAWDCSMPWLGQAVATILTGGVAEYYKDRFSMACVRHDGCYRHGKATYGLSRTQCDNMFYEDMKKTCAPIASWSSVLSAGITSAGCSEAAGAYYKAVQNFGESHYHGSTSTRCYYDRRNENAHVHAIDSAGKFGSADHRYMWSSGWWVVSAYNATATSDNLLLLKPGNGSVHLHRPVENGAVAHRIADYDWSSGWTTAKGYRVGDRNFLFLLKAKNGVAQVREVADDGKVGAKVKEYNWSDGWTSAEFYEVAGKSFVFLLKGQDLRLRYMLDLFKLPTPGGSGLARVYELNPDGTLGKMVKEYDWSAGWSIATPFAVNGKKFMLLLKSDNGSVHVHEINDDGSIGRKVDDRNWSSGWTVAEAYEINGQTFVFLLKSAGGAAKIYQMKADGSIGALVTEYDWSDGWTSATFYRVNDRLYALLVKAVEGGK